MQAITRTPIATGDPVTAEALADHLRLEAIEAASAMRYARAAADEIEQYANLALLDQTITFTSTATEQLDGLTVLRLPIGPNPESITVQAVASDGTLSPSPNSWIIYNGVLRFATHPERPVQVTYTAGYGADAAAIPDDLSLAILDQALRLYDRRGDVDNTPGLAPSTARICARYRRVAV